MTPESVKIHFTEVLGQEISNLQKLSGTSSYPCYRVSTSENVIFVKTHNTSTEVFRREATGLKALKSFGANTPEVIAYDSQYLALDFIETETPTKNYWSDLATQLVKIHKHIGTRFGNTENNFIGRADQINLSEKNSTWADFFWNHRLLYKINEIHKKGVTTLNSAQIEKLKSVNYNLLENHDCHPSPLHGDLWSGNILCAKNQSATLIDPAFYYGDREADIAMTECFGGFDAHFYDVYNQQFPLASGYDNRKHIYNLYHMLNHQLIFGEQYHSTVFNILALLIK